MIVPGQGGRPVSPLALQWTSSDPNIVRVSLTGVITGVSPGSPNGTGSNYGADNYGSPAAGVPPPTATAVSLMSTL